MSFDISLKFSVETGELINARNALQSLSQVANELNNNQNKATATAERLAAASDSVTKSSSQAAKATKDFSNSMEEAGDDSDMAEKRLQRLKDQLGYLNGRLIESETGLTKMQAGMMASMKAIGATQTQLQEFAKVFDQFNKITGNSPFDQSAKGMAMLNNELRELERSSQLVKDGITLTSQQTKMLTRDLEALKQQNEALGKSALDGASEYERAFIEKAKAVNNLRAVAAEAEREEKERAKQAAAIAKEEERFYAAAAKEYEEQERRKTEALQREEAKRLAIIENARKSVNDKLMSEWASGVGVKSPELSKMASGYEQEMKAQAAAAKVAADAINYLEQEQRKLAATTELMARGFTAASANALYKYKEALEATGASAMEMKQKLYTFEQDLIKRQDKSPFAQMRKDIKQVQEDTNHLARAISVQLGDVAVSLAGGMNPFLVLIQQGDQIRFAVQQAKDAGQDLSKVMQGAFASMASSFKLVFDVVKEFAVDGMRSLSNAFTGPLKHMAELHSINNQLSSGLIDSAKAAELNARSSELLAGSMRTLNLVLRGGVLAALALLAAAYVSLSREQDKVAKMNAQFGASFGATTQEALSMARGLREFGVSTAQAVEAMSGLMKAGKIGKESFEGIALAASEANKWVGISIEETIKKFNELADDPMKVLSEFTIQTGYLSQAQLQLVRDHLEAGDSAKAQAEAIKLLEGGYRQMASQAKQDMSSLGVAMNELKDTTNTLWDAFKNSSAAKGGIDIVTAAVKTLASAAIGAVFGIKAVATALIFLNDISPAQLALDAITGGPSLASKFAALESSLKSSASESRQLIVDLWGVGDAANAAAGGVSTLTAEQRAQNAESEDTKKRILALKDAYKQSNEELAKSVDVNTYVAKRLVQENEKILKGATLRQREEFFASKAYMDSMKSADKKFREEWEKANKESTKSVATTYKTLRDNELVEIKKFQDLQLKGLKDFEQKQSQVNKSAYDSRMISLGEYLAKEISLVQNSKAAQEAIISESEAKYRAELQQQIAAHEAAASAAIKAGGSRKAITEQLTQQIQNLNNAANSTIESFKQQREALENATDAKYAKFYEEIAKQVNASNDALEKFNETVDENARKREESLETQRALLGLYGAEAEAYKASRSAMSSYRKEIDAADRAFQKAKKSREDFQARMSINSTQQEFDAYNALLKAEENAKKNSIATLEKAQVDSNKAAMDAIEAYNLEVFKEIRDALSEDIYNALFEGGKKGGNALKSVLKKMFKNYVINVILNPIMGNIANTITSSLGFGGVSGGIPGTGSGLDFMNLGGSIGDWLMTKSTELGINGWSSMSDAAFALGDTIKGIDTWLKDIPGFEGGVGSVFGYAQALYSLSQGQYGAAIGAAIGTYILPGIGTMIGSTLGGLIDGMFGGGTPHAGAAAKYSGGEITGSGKEYTKKVGVTETYRKEMQAPIDALAMSIGGALDGLAKQFGGSSGYSVQVGFKSDNDDPSNGQFRVVDANGKILREWEAYQRGKLGARSTGELYDKDPQKGFDQYLQSITSATIPIVQDIVPGWAGDLLDQFSKSIGIDKALERGDKNPWKQMTVGGAEAFEALQKLLAEIVRIDEGFKSLGQTMSMFNGISDEMKSTLLKVFGGIDGLAQVAGVFYQNFYSEEEKLKAAGDSINEAMKSLGVNIDVFNGAAAKVDFRKAIEKAFADGDEELAASLLAISGAFAEVANAADQANEAIRAAAKDAAKFLVDNALANLEAAVERITNGLQEQITTVTAAINAHKALGDMLKRVVRELRGEVESTRNWSADQGMLYIKDTLAKVKAGSNILDFVDLELAINAARTGLSTKAYTTQFEKDREALVLANQLEELDELNGKQLSVEEKQLKVLQEQLDYYQAYLKSARDMVNGVNTLIDKTLSPEQAYALLLKAMSEAQGVGKGDLAYDDYIRRKAGAITDPTIAAMQEKIKEIAKSFEGSNDPVGLWKAITAAGGNEYDLNALYGWAIADLKNIIKYMGDTAYEDYLKRKVGAENDPTIAAMQQSIKDAAKVYEGTGDVKGLWEAIKKAGGNEFDLNALYGWAIEDLRKVIKDIESAKPPPGGGGAVFGPGESKPSSSGDAAYDDYNSRSSSSILGGDAAKTQMDIRNAAKQYEGSGDVAGLWSAVKSAGGNEYDLAHLYGWDVNDIKDVVGNLPSYDIGTNYVPRDMVAQIHEGEMIVPKRFNPSTSGLNNNELKEELKALREEVVMLRAEARATAVNTGRTFRILDDVTQGGDTVKVVGV